MKTIAKVLFGSKLYGTDTPESDTDYKEIFVPDAESILLGTVKNHMSYNTSSDDVKNTAEDVDYESFSLRYFINLGIEGETLALDMIHAPANRVVHSDLPAVWAELQANRSHFYSTDMKSYLGYVRKQAGKYGVKGSRMACLRQVMEALAAAPSHSPDPKHEGKRLRKTRVGDIAHTLPLNEFCEWTVDENQRSGFQDFYVVLARKFQTSVSVEEMQNSLQKTWDDYGHRARQAELNEGIDFKALSHALRGGLQLKEIYSTGDLVYPLKDREYLIKVKAGEIPFKEIQVALEGVVSEVEKLSVQAKKNGMQEKADPTFWDKFIREVYLDEILSVYGPK